jgi:hypothetical protein
MTINDAYLSKEPDFRKDKRLLLVANYSWWRRRTDLVLFGLWKLFLLSILIHIWLLFRLRRRLRFGQVESLKGYVVALSGVSKWKSGSRLMMSSDRSNW